jgi:ABC-type Fe3+ transport system substrate-binding protein
MTELTRRTALLAASGLLAMPARASVNLDALAREAAAESGDLSWYESNPLNALDRVATAFGRGPGGRIRVRPESVPGGVGIVGRVANEAQAGGRTADVVSLGGSGVMRLQERNLLADAGWRELGFPESFVAGPSLLTAAALYCVIYNKNEIRAEDAPKTWDDLLDPRFRGRIGSWVRMAAFAELAHVWGEARVNAYYERFLAQNPMLFRSTAPLAQQVAAGEVAVGLGIYHTALPAIRRGAPIEIVLLDPTPVSAIWTAVTTPARRPKAAKLLGAWLATPDGARAYEAATERGHPLLAETDTGRRVGRLTLAEWPMTEKDEYARIFEALNARVNEASAR